MKPAHVGRDLIRDLRIIARRGDGFYATARLFGWSPDKLQRVCRENEIRFRDAPQRDLPRTEVINTRPRTTRADGSRVETIAFQTTKDMRSVMRREGEKRRVTNSKLVHDILVAIETKGLWVQILDLEDRP